MEKTQNVRLKKLSERPRTERSGVRFPFRKGNDAHFATLRGWGPEVEKAEFRETSLSRTSARRGSRKGNQPFPFRFFKFSIQRYHPPSAEGELPQAPTWERYELPYEEHLTVLEALHRIKGTQDATISYRWSCQMGICGSCGMVVNGKPVLACSTFCKDIMNLKGELNVQPMRHMPILKDLIVDIDDPMDKMRSVMPYLDRVPEAGKEKRGRQSKKQRERIDQTSQCIKCMLCYSACPVYGQEKSFIGPGAGALAYRYLADSRDSNADERLDNLVGKENSVWGCSFIGECSSVCPKRVDPAKALQRLKVMGALQMIKKTFSFKKAKS